MSPLFSSPYDTAQTPLASSPWAGPRKRIRHPRHRSQHELDVLPCHKKHRNALRHIATKSCYHCFDSEFDHRSTAQRGSNSSWTHTLQAPACDYSTSHSMQSGLRGNIGFLNKSFSHPWNVESTASRNGLSMSKICSISMFLPKTLGSRRCISDFFYICSGLPYTLVGLPPMSFFFFLLWHNLRCSQSCSPSFVAKSVTLTGLWRISTILKPKYILAYALLQKRVPRGC